MSAAAGKIAPLAAPAIVREADTTPGSAAATPWAVRMRDIGKRYRLGETRSLNENFREDLMAWGRRLFHRAPKKDTGEFWALRHIDLDVARGETVGIIGRNGAGKSTLLKILSRITLPTEGELRYRGRLASLLEVGTGFHRELTGRENIYLNGAILGMTRPEIDRAFHAIVDFAGVEKFLDTPVKRYSSGMYVRLAFAVAAHLRTDILVVDEVLAVGDAEFQKKCLGKMQDVAGDGRTVFFVSHNMGAVRRLCRTCFVLKGGAPVASGSPDAVISSYMLDALASSNSGAACVDLTARRPEVARGSRRILTFVQLGSAGSGAGRRVPFGSPIELAVGLSLDHEIDEPSVQIGVDLPSGERLVTIDSRAQGSGPSCLACGSHEVRLALDELTLMPGSYTISKVMVRAGRIIEELHSSVMEFEVGEHDSKGTPPLVTSGALSCGGRWSWHTLEQRVRGVGLECAQS